MALTSSSSVRVRSELRVRWDLATRQTDYWLTVFRRTWKGGAFTSFVVPLLFVAAMGVLLGGFVSTDPSTLEGATSYLDFLAPGLIATHALQTGAGETLWPVMGMFKWNKTYLAMTATPLTPIDMANAHLGAVAVRLALVLSVFSVALVPFGVYHSVIGALLVLPAGVLVGMALSACIYAYSVTISSEVGLALMFRLGVLPMTLFSGAFFPISNLPGWLEAIAKVSPLWHGVDLMRMLTLARVDGGMALLHVVYLLLWLLAGWWLGGRQLAKRLAV